MPAGWFAQFAKANNIPVDVPVIDPPTPGQTETVIPMDVMDEFSANATFSWADPDAADAFGGDAGGGGGGGE